MAIGKNLLKEKTNVGVKASTTFNSPGNYKAPYGKTVVSIGGRGASGNPGNPGNYGPAPIPGNYTPGNYVPGNPTTYIYVVNVYSPGPGQPNSFSFQTAPGPSPRSHFSPHSYWGQSLHQSANYTTYYNSGAFTNPGTTNPTTPGHTGNPGNAGNPGSNATIEGVYFPAGAGGSPGNGGNAGSPGNPGTSGSTAPTVSPTVTTVQYTEAGISITVPSGGYVDVSNA